MAMKLSLKSKRLLALTTLAAFGVCASGCEKSQPQALPYEASVNGEKIMPFEFYSALRLSGGGAVMERLVQQKLIQQEGKKFNLSADDPETVEQLENYKKQYGKDEGAYKVIAEELKSRVLERKLLLKDVTEQQERKFYETFQEDLEQFETFEIVVGSSDVSNQVRIALQGGSDFATVAATSSLDEPSKSKGGRVGFATRQTLLYLFGPAYTERFMKLKPGEVSPPLPLDGGRYLFLKRGLSRSTFEELKPSIESIMIDSERAALMYRLMTEANIDSPYLSKTMEDDIDRPDSPSSQAAPRSRKHKTASKSGGEEAPVTLPDQNAAQPPAISLPRESTEIAPAPAN